jgi:hypothetical protein
MKEQKPSSPGSGPDVAQLQMSPDKKETEGLTDRGQPRAGPPDHKAPKLQPNMQTKMNTRKNRGRLNRDTMKLLGKVLGDYFDHVRQQDVPDHITNLVKQYEERTDKGSS